MGILLTQHQRNTLSLASELLLPTLSIRNAISQQLELIVTLRRIASIAPFDQIPHKVCCLSFTLLQHESLSEMSNCLWLEAGQSAAKHECNNIAKLSRVLS